MVSSKFIIERKTRAWHHARGYDYNLVTRRTLRRHNRALLIDFDNTLVEFNKEDRARKMPFRKSSVPDWTILESLAVVARTKPVAYEHLVIVTNQKKMAPESPLRERLREKLQEASEQIERALKIPVSIVACTDEATLKPECYHVLEELPFNYTMMVGDAGGEPADYGRQDIDLAERLGIPFLHVDKLLNPQNVKK